MDGDLVQQAAKGDLQAFEQIVRKYQRWLFGYSVSRVDNHEDAEEIVQETFIKVWIHLRNLRNTGTFSAWLLSICRNAIHQFHRNRNRMQVHQDISGNFNPEETAQAEKEAEHELSHYSDLLGSAISRLTEEQREILQLRFYSGLSYKEIAACCHIPEKLVKSRLYEAKQKMKTLLPHLIHGIDHTPQYYEAEKEKLMKSIQMIETGTYVIKRLSLKNQMELLQTVEEDGKFPQDLLAALGEIRKGKEFLTGYGNRLLFPDLIHILNFDPELEAWLMNNLQEVNPDFFDRIARNLFVFEDITLLDQNALDKLVEEIDAEILLRASLTCPVTVKSCIMKLLAKDDKIRSQLLQRIPTMETGVQSIYKAQYKAVQVIRDLEAQGKIRVQRGD